MVSPELLRRYPFFGLLEDSHIKAIAMIAEEITAGPGEVICENDQPAHYLYVLVTGGAEFVYRVVDPDNHAHVKEFFVGELVPGDIFGISALIEPHVYATQVRATAPCTLVQLDGSALRALCQVDVKLDAIQHRNVAEAAMERLHHTRIELAAARA
jgi:CRP-like cAMP-binding protein